MILIKKKLKLIKENLLKLPGRKGRSTPIDSMCNIFWHFHHCNHFQDLDEQLLLQPVSLKINN